MTPIIFDVLELIALGFLGNILMYDYPKECVWFFFFHS